MNTLKNSQNDAPYQSSGLADYFSNYRNKWEDFYPSEKWVIERISQTHGGLGNVLDVGCACGGLGQALASRGLLKSYSGVDVSRPLIEAAFQTQARFRVPARFHLGDIASSSVFPGELFDTVFSLGCADWNIHTDDIINAAWGKVALGGNLLISLRLTDSKGVNDIRKSYQNVHGSSGDSLHHVNYVVMNCDDAVHLLSKLPQAAKLVAYGYWGKPSPTAVTPYDQLIFSVFAVQKSANDTAVERPTLELNLPTTAAGGSSRATPD